MTIISATLTVSFFQCIACYKKKPAYPPYVSIYLGRGLQTSSCRNDRAPKIHVCRTEYINGNESRQTDNAASRKGITHIIECHVQVHSEFSETQGREKYGAIRRLCLGTIRSVTEHRIALCDDCDFLNI